MHDESLNFEGDNVGFNDCPENFPTDGPNSDVIITNSEKSLYINTETTVDFLNGKITFHNSIAMDHTTRILLAQLEVLGTPYLEALKKQCICFDETTEEQIRCILDEAGK